MTSSSFRDDIDGSFWDVGFRWTPNSRTTVDVGVGERFFGSNPTIQRGAQAQAKRFQCHLREIADV